MWSSGSEGGGELSGSFWGSELFLFLLERVIFLLFLSCNAGSSMVGSLVQRTGRLDSPERGKTNPAKETLQAKKPKSQQRRVARATGGRAAQKRTSATKTTRRDSGCPHSGARRLPSCHTRWGRLASC